jgi:hypothetical protein
MLFFNEGLVALALTPIIVGFIYAFIILPTLGSSNKLGIILPIVVVSFGAIALEKNYLSPRINNTFRRI